MSTKYERLGGTSATTQPPLLNSSVNSEGSGSRVHYKTYKRRWFVLAVLCVLNLSNAMAWITFAAVADEAASYYQTTLNKINWLSLVFMIFTIPFGFLTSWLLDTYGLRVGLILGGWFNGIGLAIRYISSLHQIVPSQYSFIVVLIGQSICAIAQPFVLFAPTKLAAHWFPDSQRAIANTIASTSNPLGLMIAFAVCPAIVKTSGDIPELLLYFAIPGAVGVVLVTFGIWSGLPPTPPSASAAVQHESFLQGLKKIVRNGPFIILVICFGAGFAGFSTVVSIVEEILCARGYNDSFSDLCGALTIGCGMVGALIAGLYVDRTKKFEEVAKVGFALAALSFVVFAVFSTMRDKEAYIISSLALFGLFGFAMYPICFELGVECVYPVSEGTSAGFMTMSGQVQGIVLILLNTVLSKPLSPAQMKYQQCSINGTTPSNGTDMFAMPHTYSATLGAYSLDSTNDTQPMDTKVTVLFYAGFMCLASVVFLIFFRTEYKRLRAEHFSATDRVLNYSSRNMNEQNRSIYS